MCSCFQLHLSFLSCAACSSPRFRLVMRLACIMQCRHSKSGNTLVRACVFVCFASDCELTFAFVCRNVESAESHAVFPRALAAQHRAWPARAADWLVVGNQRLPEQAANTGCQGGRKGNGQRKRHRTGFVSVHGIVRKRNRVCLLSFCPSAPVLLLT